MWTVGIWCWLLLVSQIVLCVLSPRLKRHAGFNWYYYNVYRPFLQDEQKYAWKYYAVPLLYLAVYLYVVGTYAFYVLPLLKEALTVAEIYILVPFLLVVMLFTGWKSVMTPAASYKNCPLPSKVYPYDNILYYPNVQCRTCHELKPARSKHCNICQTCIFVADHHCIWVNNCIGQGNYVYFYSFLLSNALALTYASLRVGWIILWYHITVTKPLLTFLSLCVAFSILVDVFTYHQLSQLNDGMTTNEKDKWYLVQQFMRDGQLVNTPSGSWYFHDPEETGDHYTKFYSTNAYDHRMYQLDSFHVVRDPNEIPNVYDLGSFWKNFQDICA